MKMYGRMHEILFFNFFHENAWTNT